MTALTPQQQTGLHVVTVGDGPDVVLLHGWAMHGGVWDELTTHLSANFTLHVVDLPGHGLSPSTDHLSLPGISEAVFEAVMPRLSQPAIWLGWSLGGLVVMQIALDHREWINKLVLTATSPCFSKQDDWHVAIDADVLAMFATQLAEDFASTLQRFLALQVKGSEHARQALRELKARMLSVAQPEQNALAAGLVILENTDLKQRLVELTMPVMLVAGAQDMLVPQAAIPKVAGMLPNAQYRIIESAGHAPFISHPQQFNQILDTFIYD